MSAAALESWLWLAWGVYWVAAARGASRAESAESAASRLAHLVPTALCATLLFARGPAWPLQGRAYPALAAVKVLGLALTAAGLLFSVWARVHLGRHWSAIVTLKEGHELIRSGPYGLSRHPIYTGILAAFLGTALSLGEWRGFAAFALLAAAFWRKLGVEEAVLARRFGEQYARYRREVPALMPRVFARAP